MVPPPKPAWYQVFLVGVHKCPHFSEGRVPKEETGRARGSILKITLLLLYININIDIYTTESAHPTLAKGCGVEAGVATLYKSKYRLDSDLF